MWPRKGPSSTPPAPSPISTSPKTYLHGSKGPFGLGRREDECRPELRTTFTLAHCYLHLLHLLSIRNNSDWARLSMGLGSGPHLTSPAADFEGPEGPWSAQRQPGLTLLHVATRLKDWGLRVPDSSGPDLKQVPSTEKCSELILKLGPVCLGPTLNKVAVSDDPQGTAKFHLKQCSKIILMFPVQAKYLKNSEKREEFQ